MIALNPSYKVHLLHQGNGINLLTEMFPHSAHICTEEIRIYCVYA